MGVIAAYIPLNFISGTLPSGTIVSRTSTQIVFTDGQITTTIKGYDFSYSGAFINDGVVTGFTVENPSGVVFEGAGFSVFAPSVIAELNQGDTAGLTSLILTGNDDIFGSAYGDVLAGYGGDDDIAPNSGDDDVYGGTGFDTVFLSGTIADYAADNIGPRTFIIKDMNLSNGDEGTDILYDVEAVGFQDGSFFQLSDTTDAPAWARQSASVEVVASTYQFFTGSIPTAAGFEFLVSSPTNPQDLSDAYYADFNTENRFINFASNLGTEGAGRSFFNANYGNLSFTAAVTAAYQEITGKALVGAALDFFLDAEGFYEGIAQSRVVRPGVELDDATKIVAIGSILNEAIKAGTGPDAEAIDQLLGEIYADGQSSSLGHDLFAVA